MTELIVAERPRTQKYHQRRNASAFYVDTHATNLRVANVLTALDENKVFIQRSN